MILKQVPEDFEVVERPLIEISNKGKYSFCELSKKNYNTEDALFEVAKQLRIPRKFIGFAGTKDKVAHTTQTISVVSSLEAIRAFTHRYIALKFLGKHDEPLSLGRLKGNRFRIVVRDLTGSEKISEKPIINYFHNQRFSENNVVIGKFLLKKNYRSAVDILRLDSSFGRNIDAHLQKSTNDFVGALKTIPKKILTLYLHAYQSMLWNRAVDELLKTDDLPEQIPIPGFSGFSADDKTTSVINKLMVEEGISFNDFLNRDIPYLCVEGTCRKTISELSNLFISAFFVDELNYGKKKLVLSFELGKGEYATNVVDQLFS